MTTPDEVLARERAFHDERFAQPVDPRDALAKYYTLHTASKTVFQSEITKGCAPGGQYLEYGCGDGLDLKFCAPLGVQLHGIDISKEAVTKAYITALEHGVDVSYVVGDAHHTPFESGKFSVIAGAGILHHLDLRDSLRELARITKPGGRCVFLEPLGHNPLIRLFRWLTPTLRSADEHPLRERDFFLMAQYFGSVQVAHFYLATLVAVLFRKTRWFGRIYSRLNALDEWIFARLPSLQKHAWVVVITLAEPRKGLK